LTVNEKPEKLVITKDALDPSHLNVLDALPNALNPAMAQVPLSAAPERI
jgi:hypothetical protein